MSAVDRVRNVAAGARNDRERSVALPPSPMLLELLSAMRDRRIPYCYWKSSDRVESALAGASDLDLLVDRRARERVTMLLRERGFKSWPDAAGYDHPGIESFLGYEEASQAIRHVHVCFRLLVGHSLLKTYRVPIEDGLIARATPHPRLPILGLDPVDEALLLIVRSNLEMRRTDPIALRRWSELQRKYTDALAHIAAEVDADALRRRARELFSAPTAQRVSDALNSPEPSPSGRLRAALARELGPHRIYGSLEAAARTWARCALFAAGEINRRWLGAPRAPRRRCPGGGVLIAFVGVDGSGKSTQVASVRDWLGPEIAVAPFYFGSGDGAPSLVFRPFKAVARRIAARIRVKPKGASHGRVSDRPPGPLYAALFAVWALAVALDKRTKLIAAQRAIARGFVVVTDRYPQDENAWFNDGPLLHRLERAPAWLRRLEESIYAMARRAPPDLVIKLHVGPATVAKREPDMAPNIILQRIEWLKELKFAGARLQSIDATRPLAEVGRLAKRAIWDIL